jgi:bidirectional [NiFe] hydrogenase diaphorase subunit
MRVTTLEQLIFFSENGGDMVVGKVHQEVPRCETLHADSRLKIVDRALKRVHFQQDALIEVLHSAQGAFGFLSNEILIYVARQLWLPASWVYGVATFYHFFTLEPQGEHTCVVCLGTACYVKRSIEIISLLQSHYGVAPGETTADGKLSLATARCLGSCSLAPVMVVDDEVLARETPSSALAKLETILSEDAQIDVHGVIAADDKPEGEALGGSRQ